MWEISFPNSTSFWKLLFFVVFISGSHNGNQNFVQAENILVYGVLGSYSQRITMWPMIEALADRGHNVTFLSPYESKKPNPKIHDYAPKLWKETMGSWESHHGFFQVRKNRLGILQSWFGFPALGQLACETLYQDEEFVRWIKSSKFDLVIVDSLMNECAFGMIHFWETKFLVYGTSTVYGWYIDQLGFPDESSSVTDITLGYPAAGTKMSFQQRFVNAMIPLAWMILREYMYLPKLEDISKKGLGLDEIPSFSAIERNASLNLVTTHYTIDYPRSFPPNAMPIGGIVVSDKLEPLPKEIEDFIAKSKNGFIYVSFGTVAEFVNFDETIQKIFINAITSFPDIRYVWKSTFPINATLNPDHVIVTNWIPQQTILAHPKIKAFITHAGMGSTAETINFQVPAITFPVLADQDMNANYLEARGAAIKLEITTLEQNELEDAINEILHNPKYRAAMKRLSSFYKDRPMSALDTAIWWIEFVLRHENTNEYLQPPTVGQPWWVKRQIDVWLAALVLVVIVVSLPIYLIVLLVKYLVYLTASFSSGKLNKPKKKLKTK